MTRLYTDLAKFKQAKLIANEGNCFIVDKGQEFLLYRKGEMKNTFVGKRSTCDGILELVKKVTKSY